MSVATTSKRTEKSAKILALLLGILIGGFYASFSRLAIKQVSYKSGASTIKSEETEVNETAQFLVSDDTSIADIIADSMRVLCWVHTKNYEKERFIAINKTWGVRCTSLITIISSGANSTNIFNIPNVKNQSSNIENVYRFIYQQFGDKFDWFLKTDGNSYVVMENLRYKLYAYNPSEATGFGLMYKQNVSNTIISYLADKAGYVLSKKAVENIAKGYNGELKCRKTEVNKKDEIRFGLCLKEVGVVLINSTDEHSKQQFFDKCLDDFFLPKNDAKLPYPWYQDYKVNHYLHYASNYSIAFAGLRWQQMHVMEFLIYQLRPYGIETHTPPLPERISVKS